MDGGSESAYMGRTANDPETGDSVNTWKGGFYGLRDPRKQAWWYKLILWSLLFCAFVNMATGCKCTIISEVSAFPNQERSGYDTTAFDKASPGASRLSMQIPKLTKDFS